LITNCNEPDLAGKPDTSCYPKPTCGGDSRERATRLLAGPVESMTFCPFGSKVRELQIEGTADPDLPGEPARTGREHRYPGLLMLKGCGIERKQGAPVRTSGPIPVSPVFLFSGYLVFSLLIKLLDCHAVAFLISYGSKFYMMNLLAFPKWEIK